MKLLFKAAIYMVNLKQQAVIEASWLTMRQTSYAESVDCALLSQEHLEPEQGLRLQPACFPKSVAISSEVVR